MQQLNNSEIQVELENNYSPEEDYWNVSRKSASEDPISSMLFERELYEANYIMPHECLFDEWRDYADTEISSAKKEGVKGRDEYDYWEDDFFEEVDFPEDYFDAWHP